MKVLIDDGLNLAGYDRYACTATALLRYQRTGPPAFCSKSPYPTPDRRPADAEFPNRVPNAAFQTA